MRTHLIILLGAVAAFSASCSKSQTDNVVKETYIHKYGVPVAKQDWDVHGQDGKIVQLTSEGVTITKSLVNGVLEGETTYTFPNSSTIQMTEIYDAGVLIARRDNYLSGVAMKEETFAGDELIKLCTWYEAGTPQATEYYEEGRLIAGEYRTPLNAIESRIQQGSGVRITRTSDGDLLAKDTIQNGIICERVTYYSNGDPSTITQYEDGKIHGTKLSFLSGGLPSTVEQWSRGLQDGITTLFMNGEKIAEVPFVRGEKHGVETRFRDGAILAEEITWRDGVQHGPRKIFIDGDAKTEWYHFGELVSRNTFERMNLSR